MALAPTAPIAQKIPIFDPFGSSAHFSDADLGGGLLISSFTGDVPLNEDKVETSVFMIHDDAKGERKEEEKKTNLWEPG